MSVGFGRMMLLRKKFPLALFSPKERTAYFISNIALLLIIILGVAVDQLTKVQSENTLMVHSSEDNPREYRGTIYPIFRFGDPERAKIDGHYFGFNFSYVRNPGAAWGMLSSLDDNIRVPFFNVLTLVCIIFIILFLRATPLSHRMARLSLTMILAGAVGNMIDRFRLNYVIDWLDVRWSIGGWYYAFPNFNIADSLISLGAMLFIVDAIFFEGWRRKRLTPDNHVLLEENAKLSELLENI